jgi:tetratricopeptide (TPR) repeat protein
LRLELAEQPDHPMTLFNLGSVYQELGQHAEALVMLRRSLERSDPRDSIVRKLYPLMAKCHQQLGELYLKSERWAELEETIHELESMPHGVRDADILRARGLLARKEFASARAIAEKIVAAEPQDLNARVFLSQVLLQEGQGLEAEKVLREILSLAPNHQGASRSLAVLLAQRQREARDAVFQSGATPI